MSDNIRIPKTALWLAGLAFIILFLYTLLDTSATGIAPERQLSTFATRFLGIFIEATPFLLMGSFVSGLLEVFISKDDILRILPKNPALATVGGAFLGFAFPVCECGVVPVTRRLFIKGLPMSVGIAFLLAAL